MSGDDPGARHPFLDDLADDVVLTTNVLSGTVSGKSDVLAVVRAGGTIYTSQRPTYLRRFDDRRTLLEYDADLLGGRTAHAVVVIDWNVEGKVSHLTICFAPLGAALAFATRLGEALGTELGQTAL